MKGGEVESIKTKTEGRKEGRKEGRRIKGGELIYTGGGYTIRILSVLSRHSETERGSLE